MFQYPQPSLGIGFDVRPNTVRTAVSFRVLHDTRKIEYTFDHSNSLLTNSQMQIQSLQFQLRFAFNTTAGPTALNPMMGIVMFFPYETDVHRSYTTGSVEIIDNASVNYTTGLGLALGIQYWRQLSQAFSILAESYAAWKFKMDYVEYGSISGFGEHANLPDNKWSVSVLAGIAFDLSKL